ncbi:MAG: hypothetical protein ACP5UN_00195 [Candidatus Micrarchaeia archaeon]
MNTILVVVVALVVIGVIIFGLAFFKAGSTLGASSSSPSSSVFSSSYPNLGLINSSSVSSVLGGNWNEVVYYQGSNYSKSPGYMKIPYIKYLGLANFTSSDPNRTYNITYAEFNSSKVALNIYKLGTVNMNPIYNGIYDNFNYTMLENSKGGVIIFYANYYNYDIVMMYTQNNTSAPMPPESEMVSLLNDEVSTSR